MKPITRDVSITLLVKVVLLVLLWWVCVKGMHPILSSSQEWLLGKNEQPAVTQTKNQR